MSGDRQFVLEIEPTVSGDGSTQLFLLGTRAFATGPADTPPNKPVLPWLDNPGSVQHQLFGGKRLLGAVKPSYGFVTLTNSAPDVGAAGELDAWQNYGLADSLIVVRWGVPGTPYPAAWTEVYRAYVERFQIGRRKATIYQRDGMRLLEAPVAPDGYAGTGGVEGSGSVPGVKAFVSQDPGFFEPVLVDVQKQIYCVHWVSDGGLRDSYLTNPGAEVNPFDVFVGGVEPTRVTPHYASEAELFSTAPAPGTVRYYFGPPSTLAAGWANGPVFFRLGTPAASDVRVFGVGYPTDADHARRGAVLGQFFASHIALRAGVSLERIDTGRDVLQVGPQLADDGRSGIDVLNDAAQALHAYFGFDRRDRFRSGYLLDPADRHLLYGVDPAVVGTIAAQPTTSVRSFTAAELVDLERIPVGGNEVPAWRVQAEIGETWPGQVAGGASPEVRDYLTRQVWSVVSARSDSTKLAEPGAESQQYRLRGRWLQSPLDLRVWLERFFVLFGGRHHFYEVTLQMTDELLALELMDVVTLVTPRFGMDAGQKVRIVAMQLDCSRTDEKPPQITFIFWGGTKGALTAVGGSGSGGGGGGSGGGGGPPTADPALARDRIEDFSGVMFGVVETTGTAGSPGTVGAETALIEDFSGVMYGTVHGDPRVVLLLNFEGSDDSTAIDDESLYDDDQTGTSHTRVHSDHAKFGASSLKVTRYHMTAPVFTHAELKKELDEPIGVEFWLRHITSGGHTVAPALFRWSFSDGAYFQLANYGSTAKLVLDTQEFGQDTTQTDYTSGAWVHVRVQITAARRIWVRVGGVAMFDIAATGIWGAKTTGAIAVGNPGFGSDTDACDIRIDNFRAWRGYEYPDEDFTPPTDPHGDSMPS